MKAAEVLHRPLQRGPTTIAGSLANVSQPWAGRATISSGSSVVTVSTSLVTSGAIISLTPQHDAAITSLFALKVMSLVAGVSFGIATVNEAAVAPAADVVVMWELKIV